MKIERPRPIYLKDYVPSPYLIDTVDLDISLEAEETTVRSKAQDAPQPHPQGAAQVGTAGAGRRNAGTSARSSCPAKSCNRVTTSSHRMRLRSTNCQRAPSRSKSPRHAIRKRTQHYPACTDHAATIAPNAKLRASAGSRTSWTARTFLQSIRHASKRIATTRLPSSRTAI